MVPPDGRAQATRSLWKYIVAWWLMIPPTMICVGPPLQSFLLLLRSRTFSTFRSTGSLPKYGVSTLQNGGILEVFLGFGKKSTMVE